MLITAGLAYWRTGRDTQIFIHPPLAKRIAGLAALAAGARSKGADDDFEGIRTLYRSNREHAACILAFARWTTAAGALALTLVVSLAARRFWGDAAGMLAAGLMAVEPNLLANGSLATTDLWLTLFVTLFAVETIRLCRDPAAGFSGARLGIWAGLALATKFSAIGFLPAVVLGVRLSQGGRRGSRSVFWHLSGAAPRAAGLAALIVVAAYSVHVRIFEPGFGQAGPGSWWPVTLSGEMHHSLPRGLTWAATYATEGVPAFFHGAVREGMIPAYFPVVLALKVPLAVSLMAIVALGFSRGSRGPGRWPRRALACAGGAIVGSVLGSRLHVGLRHVLPAVPLLVLVAASVLDAAPPRRRFRAAIAVTGLLWAAGSTFRAAPHFLAHFNELAGGPAGGWRWVSDSSIDWGQDLPALKSWMDTHAIRELPLFYFGRADPAFHGIRAPRSGPGTPGWKGGWVAISVSRLNGSVTRSLAPFGWARAMTPVATPGWSIHVYDVNRALDGPRTTGPLPR